MLINLSNHPSTLWESPQLEAARQFGEIIDIPFPEIDPAFNTAQIAQLAAEFFQNIIELKSQIKSEKVVHLMGEYSFCFHLVTLLKEAGIKAVVSTSKRHSVMNPDGTKTIQFKFVQFRPYF